MKINIVLQNIIMKFINSPHKNSHKLHGTQYTPQLETLLPTLLNT